MGKKKRGAVLRLEDQLCFHLYACSREAIKKYKPFLGSLDITYTQFIVLLALREKDKITIKELGNRLRLDSGTLTPLLKKLEADGLVNRLRDTKDERHVYVYLTDKGLNLGERAAVAPDLTAETFLADGEAAALLDSLKKLLALL